MAHADTTKPAPNTIEYDMQPYGSLVLGELQWGEYNGSPTLRGIVIAGTETSRIFGHTSTKSVVGQPRIIYGVTQAEIDRGIIIRVAM